MFESRQQQQSHSSKVLALFHAPTPNLSRGTARARKILAWLIATAAVFAQAPAVSAGPGAFTTTTLTVSSNNVTAGTVTTLTATVTKTAPGPVTTNVTLGRVTFCDATATHCDGAAVFGTAQMTVSGTANLKLILGVGTYSIKAVFRGFNGSPLSTSAAQTVTVTANSNYISGTGIGATGSAGNYTLTGTVTTFGRATATGTVSFIDISDDSALIGTATLNAGSLLSTFVEAPGSPFSIPDGEAFIATGDFNNDGIPDLAWVNALGGSVQVALGNGDGTFATQPSIEVADPAQMLVVADVNGDGIADLIVPNSFGGTTVNVLLGIGDGTFQAPVTYFSGTQPIYVAVGDFNRDGIPDLAVVNRGDNSVSILLGIGDGTFGTAVPITVGSAPTGLVVGDFNNDGVLDLAVTNTNDGDVGILIGVGDGTFAAQTTVALPLGSNPFWLATGDLRKSGVLDLVVPDESNTHAYVLLGNNNGTFATAVAYPTGDAGEGLALGDVNGDGILDLVTANTGEDGTVSVLIGVGDGTFLAKTDYTVGNSPGNVVLADFNGDGMLDLADSDLSDGTVTVLLQAETQTAVATGVSAPGSGLQVTIGHYRGDGERAPSSSSSIPLNGNPATSTTSTLLTAAPNPVVSGTATTLTATISPIPTGCSPLGSVSFYYGSTLLGTATVNTSGVATLLFSQVVPGSYTITAEYSGDVAGLSGSISAPILLHVTTSATSTITLALSAPSVTAGTATTFTATVLNGVTPVTSGMVTFCDATATHCEGPAKFGTAALTGSGTAAFKFTFGVGTYSVDAVFASDNSLQGSVSAAHSLTVTGNGLLLSGNQLTVSGSVGNYTLVDQVEAFGSAPLLGNITFLDTSNGNALVGTAALNTATLTYGMTPMSGSVTQDEELGNVVTGDFNNDGILDFALVNNNDGPVVSVFIGNGDGTFQAQTNYAVASFVTDLKVGDFNGDGKLDLVTANPCDCDISTVSVLLGNGDGTFQPQTTYNVGPGAFGVAVGDFNGDGIPDLVTSNLEGNNVSVLLGMGDGTFRPQVLYPAGVSPISVAVGDFNGDGVLDVAVANNGDNTVSVLLGNGDGTFQAQVHSAVGGDPGYVMVADFNKDGILDLVIANQGDATISVLLGIGDGTFLPQATYATGNDPQGVAAGDLNQDGNLDLVVANSDSGTVSIFYGNGNGTFQPQLSLNVGEASPFGVATGDFNGDGLTDVVESDGDIGAIVLYGYKSETATATGVTVSGAGTHNVEASYPGDASRLAATSSTVALTGTGLPMTTTTLVPAPSPAVAGQTVTLTATIAPTPTGTPLGSVNFYNGETLLGVGTVSVAGLATFSTSTLPTGADSLTAVYSGNTTSATSTSAAVIETISPVTLTVTTTTLVAAPSPAIAGQVVTLTATIAPTPTGAPLGSVSFYQGATLLGVGTVSVAGVATFSTSTLPTGADSLTAIYSGNTTSATSTSAAAMETVALVATATTVVLAPNPPVDGQSETFTATVAPPPTGGTLGTVSFFNGAALLGMGTVNSAGVATFTTSSLPFGTLTITAVYSGSATSATSTSAATMVTVTPGFAVVGPAAPITALQGALVTVPLTVPPLGSAFNNVVTMSATGLPIGAVAVFTPPTVIPGATGSPTTLTVQLPSGSPVTTVIPFNTHHIPAWPGFALACSLCAMCGLMLRRRGVQRGLRGKARVAFACTGLAATALLIAGCSGGFSSPPFTPNGTYVVTITGTSGLSHASTTVTIIVK
jgi:Bacterial Ig-like domain (group 3)/FG-GAP-like repeat